MPVAPPLQKCRQKPCQALVGTSRLDEHPSSRADWQTKRCGVHGYVPEQHSEQRVVTLRRCMAAALRSSQKGGGLAINFMIATLRAAFLIDSMGLLKVGVWIQIWHTIAKRPAVCATVDGLHHAQIGRSQLFSLRPLCGLPMLIEKGVGNSHVFKH
jgi:hypothetical protein